MSGLDTMFGNETRLHPMSIFYRLIVNLPALLIPAYIGLANNQKDELFFLIAFAAYGILIFPMIFLNYYYFTFYISSSEFVIKSGVFSRKQRNIPLKRIQNINIEQNFLQRLLRIAVVKIETAGDAATEGQLEFVSADMAEYIRKVINSYKNRIRRQELDEAIEKQALSDKAGNDEGTKAPENIFEEETSKELFRLSVGDLIIHGMMRFRPVILVAVFTVIQYLNIMPDTVEDIQDNYYFEYLLRMNSDTIIFYLALGLVLTVILSWIADILLTVNKFYGFRLELEGNKLLTSYGLLGKRKGTVPLKKLQFMSIVSNFISRRFGFYGLQIQTAGLNENRRTPEVAVPIAKFDRIKQLSLDIKDYVFPDKFDNVSKKTIRRAMVRYLLALVPLAVISYFIFPGALWALLLAPLLYFAAVLRYQYRGYKIYDDYVLIKQGFIFQRINIIPIEKIQTIHIVASFFQRQLGLASLNIDTAGTSSFKDASIIDIDASDAENIMNEIDDAFRRKV